MSPSPPRRSLWLEEALGREADAEPVRLSGRVRADLCVVGGGYTGLWTALRATELAPGSTIALLEADICGGGASGRNGGMALPWWPKLEALVERVGEEEALRLADASADAVGELGEFCTREGIEADYVRGGWLWTATSRAQLGAWNGTLRACEQRSRRPFQVIDAEELEARTGSPVHLGGVLDPTAATVQPALLARGLRRVALARGVRIFEDSPMVDLDRQEGVVRAPGGEVVADAVVLAMNAWSGRLRELARAIIAISSDMVATEPMPQALGESGWTAGESVSNSRLMVHYYRTTADGRVAFGRGGGALAPAGRFGTRFDHDARRSRENAEDLRRLVPVARGRRITHAWGGAVDRSVDGLPFFGRLPGRVTTVYGAGFSGNGVVPCLLAGRILAASALGAEDEWSSCGLNRGVPSAFPPEPVRYLGGLVVRRAVKRKEEREDRDAPVDPLTRRVAALAPSGFFKVTPEQER